MTSELQKHLERLVEQDPLQHGAHSSLWSCRELATVLASQTGIQLGPESVRCALKKMRSATAVLPVGCHRPPLVWPTLLSTLRRSNTEPAKAS